MMGGFVTLLSRHDLDNSLIMFTQTGQEFGVRVHNIHNKICVMNGSGSYILSSLDHQICTCTWYL